MATTNQKRPRTTIRTHEGAPAARIGRAAQLRRSVMACLLWEDEFYEDGASIAGRIAEGVAQVTLEQAAEIAVEARERMHLRHVPLLIVREMARKGGDPIIGHTLARVIQRADELAEFVSLYWLDGRQPLSGQVKRGLAKAFTKFDAYQLAKYDRERAVRLRDVLFLCHAKPKDEAQAAVWQQLIDGTLPAPDTWEVALSSGKAAQGEWVRLIDEGKLGGLAVLRNLRNMQQAGVPRDQIRRAIEEANFGRVLPFRFIAAAKHAPALEEELEQALRAKCGTMARLPGKTILLVDHSMSMNQSLSAKSDMTRFDAACALAMILREVAEEVAVYSFSDEPLYVPPRRGFALRDALKNVQRPNLTRLGHAKRVVEAREGEYARLIVITDEQSQDRPTDPLGKGYVINVASARNGIGYGAWTHIDGWSEGVLRYIEEAEPVAREPGQG